MKVISFFFFCSAAANIPAAFLISSDVLQRASSRVWMLHVKDESQMISEEGKQEFGPVSLHCSRIRIVQRHDNVRAHSFLDPGCWSLSPSGIRHPQRLQHFKLKHSAALQTQFEFAIFLPGAWWRRPSGAKGLSPVLWKRRLRRQFLPPTVLCSF